VPLCLWSLWCYIDIKYFLLTSFSLPFSEPGEIGAWRGWLTIVLQCYDTVGWVIWPVKSPQNDLHSVSSGTLNPPIPSSRKLLTFTYGTNGWVHNLKRLFMCVTHYCHDDVSWLVVGWLVTFMNCGSRCIVIGLCLYLNTNRKPYSRNSMVFSSAT